MADEGCSVTSLTPNALFGTIAAFAAPHERAS